MNPEVYRAMYRCEDTHWWYQGMRACLRRLLEHETVRLDSAGEGWLLDVGCGTGGNLSLLADLGRTVGIELNAQGATFSRKRGVAPVGRASITALPFPSETFDAAVAIDVLQNVADDRRALRECFRVLRPQSALVVTVAAHPVLYSEHDVAVHSHRRYRRLELEAKLAEVGFSVSHLGYLNGLLLPLTAGWRIARRWLYGLPPPERAHTDLRPLPGWLEAIGRACLLWESRRLPGRPVPLGVSLFAIARKRSGS